MKNRHVLIILMSAIVGIFVGMMMKEYERKNDMYISKDKYTRKEIYSTNKEIKKLNKEKKKVENELEDLKNKYEDIENIKQVEDLKSNLSYTDISGSGIVIKIDAINEDVGNIANLIDYNKILVNLINEVKVNGGVFISINEQRINQYSEIVLAGSHININSIPIAQPYEIKVIGNTYELYKYVDKESNYLRSIDNNYPIKLNLKVDENINMKRMNLPNKLEYIKGE
ncbi:DUF881 domain-containing protein [Romboutsia sp.]|uniref:DUF881 domain-containing protein n=1 Tax=Romboutsia sp. TaxID=1965302 RepID=UPI002CDB6658|nr:DUF881 domain-containing protein [Romboutsia sp.]HSQ88777.1 DUF881 domain-containing protein [Romboutsia sp.]